MDFDSGNFMLPHCKAAFEGASAGPRLNVWAGQCAGVIDGLKWIGSSIEGSDTFFPPRVPPGQALGWLSSTWSVTRNNCI